MAYLISIIGFPLAIVISVKIDRIYKEKKAGKNNEKYVRILAQRLINNH